jgi:DNA-binding cell septation regulator SpoVG
VNARHELSVTRCRILLAPADQRARGLLGYASCHVAGVLAIDGISIRRSRAGALRVCFPRREGRAGRRHAIVRPLRSDVRSQIARAVLDAFAAQAGGRAA